jgi:hypothetical protein
MSPSPPEPVTALWLRKIDGNAQMLAEIDGEWRLIWEEALDGGPFSAICEARGFRGKPLDKISHGPART